MALSLKNAFIKRLEEMILSGRLAIGEQLPPERTLAAQLAVSRPVVHEGLLELAVRGLVSIRPRHGTVVNDYRAQGSVAMLSSLIAYQKGELDLALATGLTDMRLLFETETTRLAAANRTEEQLEALDLLVRQEALLSRGDVAKSTELDFQFHHLIAMASGNPVYAMLMQSFEPAYTNLSSRFFAVPGVAIGVWEGHRLLVRLIRQRDVDGAVIVMRSLLQQGVRVLFGEQKIRGLRRGTDGTE